MPQQVNQTLREIEQTQLELNESLENARRLLGKWRSLLAHHCRQQIEVERRIGPGR